MDLDEVADRLNKIETRLDNIEYVLGIRSTGLEPLHSSFEDEIRGRLTALETSWLG